MRNEGYVPMIPGVSDVSIMPRRGFIRLGESMEEREKIAKESGKKAHPAELEHLGRMDGSPEDIELYHKLYGGKPQTITIVFASNDLVENFPQEYASWNSKGQLTCYGNGQVGFERSASIKPEVQEEIDAANSQKDKKQIESRLSPDDFDYNENQVACMGKDCSKYKAKKCAMEGTLKFYIVGMKGIKLWWIRTGSRWSMKVINTMHEHIKSCTSPTGDPNLGRIRGIPLSLIREQKSFSLPNGIKTDKWVISIDAANVGISDLLSLGSPQQITEQSKKAIEYLESPAIDMGQTPSSPPCPKIEESPFENQYEQEKEHESSTGNNTPPEQESLSEKSDKSVVYQRQLVNNLCKAIGISGDGVMSLSLEYYEKKFSELSADELKDLKATIQKNISKDKDEFMTYVNDLVKNINEIPF